MEKVFAVSDIHGNAIRFKEALVEAGLTDEDLNWLNKDNWLVICGDNIDRGPDSKQVIEMLIKLVESGRVFCLAGNHEDMLLQGLLGSIPWFKCWMQNGGMACLESYGMDTIDIMRLRFDDIITKEELKEVEDLIGRKHLDFMASMFPYVIMDIGDTKTMFVHAGVDPRRTLDSIMSDQKYLWIREDFYDYPNGTFLEKRYGVERVVFGHTPISYMTKIGPEGMKPHPKHDGRFLAIDTGSNYERGAVSIVEVLPNRKYRLAARK